ncbi:MAG: 16S rRNA (adenine(1518)-N(6)/adenine(1519)-N(6))-dimethyltransferase RsmA [Candidatus Zixiibacteriota bacterium]
MKFKKPKKNFSQNFLIDNNIANKIVSFLNLSENDVVYEIGTGRGVLTEIIASVGCKIFTFELDIDLIDKLENKFRKYDNIELVNTDFLKVNPFDFYAGQFKLIGNIPYDITSPLIDWIIEHRNSIISAVITSQKELADRISSGPGSKNWAPISILSQCYFDIENKMTIPPEAFYPPPKIKSATMVFSPHNRYDISNPKFFNDIVHAAFKQRRKLLVNNLGELGYLNKEDILRLIDEIGLESNIRAEQVSIDDFIRLCTAIGKFKS